MTRAARRPFALAGWRWELLGQAHGRVLEIGCGWGHNFSHYPPDAQVFAFDVDRGRARQSHQRGTPVKVCVADAEHLAWPTAAFDTVVGTLVFCSIPQPERALAEIRRVLKPNGRLLLLEHVRSRHPRLGGAQDWLAPTWLRVTGGCHLNRNTAHTVHQAGFHIDRLHFMLGGVAQVICAHSTGV